MEHFSVAVTSIDELNRYLGLERVCEHEAEAQSVLIQVYSSSCDRMWLTQLVDAIKQFSSKAVIVGATMVGEITEGRAKTGTTVLSLSFFSATRLICFAREHLSSIFEEFTQVDMGSTRVQGGVELGLAISLGWATLMGGTISVESELGKGSSFTLSLPVKRMC